MVFCSVYKQHFTNSSSANGHISCFHFLPVVYRIEVSKAEQVSGIGC